MEAAKFSEILQKLESDKSSMQELNLALYLKANYSDATDSGRNIPPLKHNQIRSLFREIVLNNTTLKTLDLSGIRIDVTIMKELCVALKTTQIETLKLVNCKISTRSLRHLMHALPNVSTLKELYLAENQFVAKSVPYVMKYLACPECKLETLSLSDNGLCDQGIEQMFKSLEQIGARSSLKTLRIANTSFSERGFKSIMAYLKCNLPLEVINMYDVLIPGDDDALKEEFLDVFRDNFYAKRIEIDQINLNVDQQARLQQIKTSKEGVGHHLYVTDVDALLDWPSSCVGAPVKTSCLCTGRAASAA